MTTASNLITYAGERFQGLNTYPSINRAIRLIAKELFLMRSDLCTSSLSVSLASEATYGTLPSDFWGLMEDPYLSGYTWRLRPVPDNDYKIVYTSGSIPRKYQIKSNLIYIYPAVATGSSYTILGDYFANPTSISVGSDTIPWAGLFDDAIVELMIEADKVNPTPAPELRGMILELINPIVAMRDRKRPTLLRDPGYMEDDF